jgi:hypothetical protein
VVRPPYPVTVRLTLIAGERWPEIDGETALKGVDLTRIPLDRYLNAIYVWCLERIEPDKRDQWLFQLAQPIPGREVPVDVEAEMDDFAAFASAFGVKPPVPSA